MGKKLLALLVASVLLVSGIIAVSAVGNSQFELLAGTATAGEYVTVTVSYSGVKDHVGGLQFYLEYDTSVLAYVAGSRNVAVKGISESELGSDTNVGNRIHFVWESAKNAGVTVGGAIATYQFRMNPKLAEDVIGTEMKLVVRSFYKDDSLMTDYIYSDVKVTTTIAIDNNAVKDAEAKIDAIGEVTLDDATKERIDAAREAYNALTPGQRECVSNSQVLFDAEKAYDALVQANASEAVKSNAEVYRKAHETILAKTVEDLTLEDKAAVEEALAAWELLDKETQAATMSEKRLLNSLVDQLKVLEADAAVWADAEAMAKLLREKYAGVLALPEDISDDLLLVNAPGVNNFMREIEENATYNEHLKEVMAEDIAFLQALQDRLATLGGGETVNEEAVAFEQEFGWLLKYTEDDILKSDLADLQTALYAYSKLSEEAKAALPGIEEYLNRLYSKAVSLPDEVIIETVPEYITEIEKEYIYVNQDGNVTEEPVQKEDPKFVVNLLGNSINPLVWWMMGFAIFMAVAFAVEYSIYCGVRRKKKQQEVSGV